VLILRCLLSGEEKSLEFLGTFAPIGRGKNPCKLWKEWKEEKRKEKRLEHGKKLSSRPSLGEKVITGKRNCLIGGLENRDIIKILL
jgi:hypothetical protein